MKRVGLGWVADDVRGDNQTRRGKEGLGVLYSCLHAEFVTFSGFPLAFTGVKYYYVGGDPDRLLGV